MSDQCGIICWSIWIFESCVTWPSSEKIPPSSHHDQSLVSSSSNNEQLSDSDIKPRDGWGLGGQRSSRASQSCESWPSDLQERGRWRHGTTAELPGGGGGFCWAVGRDRDDTSDARQLEGARCCGQVKILSIYVELGDNICVQVPATAGCRPQRGSSWAFLHLLTLCRTGGWASKIQISSFSSSCSAFY